MEMEQERTRRLTRNFNDLHHAIINFAESCSDEVWQATVDSESWSIGTVVRHIVVAHYGWFDLVRRTINGEELPDLSQYAPDRENATHAREHANPERDEVVAQLREKGNEILTTLRGLNDEQLDWPLYFQPLDVNWSVGRFFKSIIFQAAHLASVKATSEQTKSG